MEQNGGLKYNIGTLSSLEATRNDPPSIDLILAVPRPLRLERILPIISCMGVNKLFLVGANKVEKDYFGSHLFRRPAELRQLLIEGISQAAMDCNLPDIIVRKNLREFLTKDIDTLLTQSEECITHRLIAHPRTTNGRPYEVPPNDCNDIDEFNMSKKIPTRSNATIPSETSGSTEHELHSVRFSEYMMSTPSWEKDAEVAADGGRNRVVVAIGPEGGWTHSEVDLFLSKGFRLMHLGERILRTDIAVPVVLGMANEWMGMLEDR